MFTAWKVIATVVILAVLVTGSIARPPRTPVAAAELAWLMAAVLLLYLVGGAAILDHRDALAAIVFGTGLTMCGLALWLSRGGTPPPPDDGGGSPEPPAAPTPPPAGTGWEPPLDWAFYEDQFREPVAH